METYIHLDLDPGVIPALKGVEVSIVSVANNHVGDWGRIAYIDTSLSRLKENEIAYTGGGTLLEAENPTTIVKKWNENRIFRILRCSGPNWMEVTEDNMGLLFK